MQRMYIPNLFLIRWYIYCSSKSGMRLTQASKNQIQASKKSNLLIFRAFPGNIYLFSVNNINTRKRCEICLELTLKYLRIFRDQQICEESKFHKFYSDLGVADPAVLVYFH